MYVCICITAWQGHTEETACNDVSSCCAPGVSGNMGAREGRCFERGPTVPRGAPRLCIMPLHAPNGQTSDDNAPPRLLSILYCSSPMDTINFLHNPLTQHLSYIAHNEIHQCICVSFVDI